MVLYFYKGDNMSEENKITSIDDLIDELEKQLDKPESPFKEFDVYVCKWGDLRKSKSTIISEVLPDEGEAIPELIVLCDVDAPHVEKGIYYPRSYLAVFQIDYCNTEHLIIVYKSNVYCKTYEARRNILKRLYLDKQ